MRLLPAPAAFAILFALSLRAEAAGRVDPLPFDACASLANNLETRLDAEAGFRVAIAGLDRHQQKAFGLDGLRCWIWARIGGFALPDPRMGRVAENMATAFGALGWEETENTRAFAADGPDGTVFARTQGKDTCVTSLALEDLRPNTSSAPPAPHETAIRFDISCFRKRW